MNGSLHCVLFSLLFLLFFPVLGASYSTLTVGVFVAVRVSIFLSGNPKSSTNGVIDPELGKHYAVSFLFLKKKNKNKKKSLTAEETKHLVFWRAWLGNVVSPGGN